MSAEPAEPRAFSPGAAREHADGPRTEALEDPHGGVDTARANVRKFRSRAVTALNRRGTSPWALDRACEGVVAGGVGCETRN